jgi:hypothetical protein
MDDWQQGQELGFPRNLLPHAENKQRHQTSDASFCSVFLTTTSGSSSEQFPLLSDLIIRDILHRAKKKRTRTNKFLFLCALLLCFFFHFNGRGRWKLRLRSPLIPNFHRFLDKDTN